MASRSSRAILADALEEIDRRLADIQQVVISLADGQMRFDAHAKDAIDRLGTRVHELERKAANGS